ncbi:hypothetical protein HHI36_017869 [Cryptolaemus montrouzieri]|uniref:SCP domain-containing protein n=1 Tax=Cryptolaemus montrouzieri TaxID=559131 RepID=A0ABD2NPF6_9CUCU
MLIFLSFYLATIQITQNRKSASDVLFSKYRSLLTKNYSRRWLHQITERQSTTNPYCNLCCLNISYNEIRKDCGFHTLCIYGKNESGTHCRGFMSIKFTEGEKYTIVDAHNTLRNKVARGGEIRGSPGPQPGAANMRKLEWDDELATIADRWVSRCTPTHDRCRDVDRFPVGQNIASDYASRSNHLGFIQKWYNTVQHFNANNVHRYAQKDYHDAEQYTQMVWAETYRIGCARAVFQSIQGSDIIYKEILVCNYGPAGNIPGQPVYIRGSPCAACYVGTKCESEYSALCGRICDGDKCDEEKEKPKRESGKNETDDHLVDPNINFNGKISKLGYGKCLMSSILILHCLL